MSFVFMETAVVYMVAGMSSRFGGRIKQFADVGPDGESLIEYSMNQALQAGFDKIIFIVGEKTEDSFRKKFDDLYRGVKIEYAKQTYDVKIRDKPWGTVDALLCAKKFLNCPFVVCNGDDIYGIEAFRKLRDFLIEEGEESATIGYSLNNSMPEDGTVNRGIFEVNNGEVVKIVETFNFGREDFDRLELSGDDMCSMNIFAFRKSDIVALEKILNDFKKEHKSDRIAECLLPTEVSGLIQKDLMSVRIFPSKDVCIGITNPEDEEKVKMLLKEYFRV